MTMYLVDFLKFTNTKMPPLADLFLTRNPPKPSTKNRRNKTTGLEGRRAKVKAETEGRAAGGRDYGDTIQRCEFGQRGVGDWVGFWAYWDYILYMGVSDNRGGPPKWMVYNGRPY